MVTQKELNEGYIKKLSRFPSKEEEILFFDAIVASIPKSSYLTDFFNQDCLYYIDRMIRDDFCIDPEYFFEGQVAAAAEEKLKARDAEIQELKDEIVKLKAERYEMARQRNDAVNKVEQLKKLLQ